MKVVTVLLFGIPLAACSTIAEPMLAVTGASQAPRQALALAPNLDTLSGFNLALLFGSGASQKPDLTTTQVSADGDPLEPINRVVFGFNTVIDEVIVEPTARVYRQLPEEVRTSVSNVFANLRSPITLANDVLQGEWERAGTTANRLVINTTLGIGGLYDPALEFGFEPHQEDFDQTMALAGVPAGPYLMIPFLGPASARHVAGMVVDSLANPLTWALAGQPILVQIAPRGMELVSQREKLLEPIAEIRSSSPDYYATVRSLYRQSRINSINNGRIDPEQQTETHDEIDFDF